jgi:hypothetical protein
MNNRISFNQSDIESFHWLKFKGQNEEVLYSLSGLIPVKMLGNSENWVDETVTCLINIPELTAGKGIYVHYHTSFATLNSIFNKNHAVNGGHAVNYFDLNSPNSHGYFGSPFIELKLKLAVRDVDAVLVKVGFNITLTGEYLPLWPNPPL